MSGAALARLLVGGVAIAILPALFLDADVATRACGCVKLASACCTSAPSTSKQQPVPNLGPDAFVVREDGTRREVLRVAPATTPHAGRDHHRQQPGRGAGHRRSSQGALTAFLTTIDGIGPGRDLDGRRPPDERRRLHDQPEDAARRRQPPVPCAEQRRDAPRRHRGGRQRRRPTRVRSCGHRRRHHREHRLQSSAVPGRAEAICRTAAPRCTLVVLVNPAVRS